MTPSDASGGPDGLLLVDKTAGPTSHDAVQHVRRALRTRKVGHAGTLDPFATGLLACGVGRATRLLRWLTASDKRYEGTIRFGWATDTGDVTGRPLSEPVTPKLDGARVRDAARAMVGPHLQVPPMFSAKKQEGVRLHVHARAGRVVERDAVPVVVTRFDVMLEGNLARFGVTCSAGTYVRVLAEDLGHALGCPAHVVTLRRTGSGVLDVRDAVALDALDGTTAIERLVPLSRIPLPMVGAVVSDDARIAFVSGRPVAFEGGVSDGVEVAVFTASGELLGVGLVVVGRIQPDVVLASASTR